MSPRRLSLDTVRPAQRERAVALNITTVTILTFLIVLPVAAWLSDRFGRKLMLVVGMSACLLLAYPLDR